MKKILHREKIVLFAVILNIAVFSSCFILFREVQNRNNSIVAILNDISQESEKQARYLSLKSTISETETDRATVDSFFVGKEGAVGFIELVEEQGKLSNATTTITSVKTVDDNVASSTVEVLTLEVEAGAPWANLYHFFSLLENLPHNITLGNTVIKKVEEKSNYWEADFTLQVLKLKK